MSTFNLPDLGEGLPDAEIVEWHVNVGDEVKTDQPLVSMETAKAVVEVPSPQDGKIEKLHGAAGDIIKTGAPLVEFTSTAVREDTGTVVGNIESSGITEEDNFIIGKQHRPATSGKIRATPAVRALAQRLGVNLADINASGANGIITAADVQQASGQSTQGKEGYEPLRGVRRSMVVSMTQSHQQVVPVTIFDDADIQAWRGNNDITARLVRALVKGCAVEPALNAWYDTATTSRKCHDAVHLGLAMDTADGLFVPVIRDAQDQTPSALRETINRFKQTVTSRDIPAEELQGATITLSNFGKFAGRYASPIIVPPMVAILAVGRLRDAVVAHEGKTQIHRSLPLSLTFDHRAVTGGEATRFLGAVIEDLAADA